MTDSDAAPPLSIEEKKAKFSAILFPVLDSKRTDFKQSDRDFVHYTSGENALSIIRNKEVWLRSTVCMNDFSEVQHGYDLLMQVFRDNDAAIHKQFCEAFDALHEGAALDAMQRFDSYFSSHRYRVFVACLSEYDPREDHIGKLSMWRAYGNGKTPVALVLNKGRLFTESDSANIYMSPVVYLSKAGVSNLFEQIIENAKKEAAFLAAEKKEVLTQALFIMFLFTVICCKHPGFREEHEWRLIYLPQFAPSGIVQEALETINGVPQQVYKIPLQDRPDFGLTGIEIKDLLKSVIVGPTPVPFPVCEAFVSLLNRNGVPNALEKVYPAQIPLRT